VYRVSSFANLPSVPFPACTSAIILSTLAKVFSSFFTVAPMFTLAIESDILAKFPDALFTLAMVALNFPLFSASSSFTVPEATLNSANVASRLARLLLGGLWFLNRGLN